MTDRSWGHGSGFAKPHAHDGVAGALKHRHDCAHDRWREKLMASECVTPLTGRSVFTRFSGLTQGEVRHQAPVPDWVAAQPGGQREQRPGA